MTNPTAAAHVHIHRHLVRTERVLRRNDRSLDEETRERRARCLDLLKRYVAEGAFPRNTYVPGQRPVFVDATGRLCAVGYLIAHTWGRDITESIADKHRLDYIEDIDDPRVGVWAKAHGFSCTELARIQPQYPWDPTPPSPAQLLTWHWIVTMSLPLLTAAFWKIREKDRVVRRVMIGVLLWGVAILSSVTYQASTEPGSDSFAAPSAWVLLNLGFATFFIVVGWIGYQPNGVTFRAAGRARRAFLRFLGAFSLVCLLSVAPINPTECGGKFNYDTNLGYWLSIASPLGYPRKPFMTRWRDVGGTGVGFALTCPGSPGRPMPKFIF